MNKPEKGAIFQDNRFQFEAFNGLTLEQFITCEAKDSTNIILVYIKVEKNDWHQYFLDSGYGFWQNYEDIDPTIAENRDEEYVYLDKGQELGLIGKKIKQIQCEPEQNNCRITIEFEQKKIILKAINPADFDSDSELIIQ